MFMNAQDVDGRYGAYSNVDGSQYNEHYDVDEGSRRHR
jgi:hypothetical protein